MSSILYKKIWMFPASVGNYPPTPPHQDRVFCVVLAVMELTVRHLTVTCCSSALLRAVHGFFTHAYFFCADFSLLYSLSLSLLSSTSFTYEYKSSVDSVANDLTHFNTWQLIFLCYYSKLCGHCSLWETESELLVCGSAAGSLSACGEEAAMQCDHFLWPFF